MFSNFVECFSGMRLSICNWNNSFVLVDILACIAIKPVRSLI